jgi:hypothetical protein
MDSNEYTALVQEDRHLPDTGWICIDSEIDPYVVNHLPIVKAYAQRIGLVPVINHLVHSEMEIDPGTIFLGMVLDTLSGRSPLYRLETFFESYHKRH